MCGALQELQIELMEELARRPAPSDATAKTEPPR